MTDDTKQIEAPQWERNLYEITGDILDINTMLIQRPDLSGLRAKVAEITAELERKSLQLAACGVVAMADTPESAKEVRAMHPDFESASCDDVKRRVDECMELRSRVAELEAQMDAVGAGGVGPLMAAVRDDAKNPTNIDSPMNACMYQAACKRWRDQAEQKDGEWPKLSKPARVGGGLFGVGVTARYVVEAAQRAHAEQIRVAGLTHEQLVEEERRRRKLWDLVHGPIDDVQLAQQPLTESETCKACGEGKARISVTRVCDTCGSEYAGQDEMGMAKRIEAEKQAEPGVLPEFNTWSNNDGDSWYEHPADAQIIYDAFGDEPKVGDTFTLLAGWDCIEATYRITEVNVDGDCEVECVSHPGQINPQPAQQPSNLVEFHQIEPVAYEWRYDSCGHAAVNKLAITETPEPTVFLKNVFARGPFPLRRYPQPAQLPPALCRQRLKSEGKAYPKSTCQACGSMSPNWKACDAMLVAAPEAPEQHPLTEEQIKDIYASNHWYEMGEFTWGAAVVVTRAVERALGIKGAS